MTSIAQKLSNIVGEAFESQGLSRDLGAVRVSDRPDLAQFQCNGAMAAAKQAKKNPREVAQAILSILESNENFSKLDIAGPGFINLNVTDEFIQNHLQDLKNFGIEPVSEEKNIIIDYAQPNVAKPMHVGHLRSSIIGESLKRMMRFSGYNVIGDIHLGDWGTHMGMVVSEYIKTDRVDEVLSLDLENTQAVKALLDDLSELYPRVSKLSKEDQDRLEESKQATLELQNKEEPYYGIWQKIRDVSVIAQKENFKKLDIEFDLWWGESTVHDSIAPMVENLKNQGYAIDDDGAVVFPVASNDDNKKIPPLILYKRDGAVMYGTTDMATCVERMAQFDPARMIYVVDQRQALHFEQVFRAVRKANIVPERVELTHAGFGTMNGTDGKPFKTREGGVMRLEDLISMATEKAAARLAEANLSDDIDEQEREDITHKVAIAAIKFADLQNQRQADYIFDLDRFTSFEGKTGPYVLYQAVRIKSMLAKAKAQEFDIEGDLVVDEKDRDLALLLAEFPDVLEASIRGYMPHVLCEYVYKLAQAFSSFYGNCHILSEENEGLRTSRLYLCSKVAKQLETILNLLGIDVPERM